MKIWLLKLGCNGDENVNVVKTTLHWCSQIYFRKTRFDWRSKPQQFWSFLTSEFWGPSETSTLPHPQPPSLNSFKLTTKNDLRHLKLVSVLNDYRSLESKVNLPSLCKKTIITLLRNHVDKASPYPDSR